MHCFRKSRIAIEKLKDSNDKMCVYLSSKWKCKSIKSKKRERNHNKTKGSVRILGTDKIFYLNGGISTIAMHTLNVTSM